MTHAFGNGTRGGNSAGGARVSTVPVASSGVFASFVGPGGAWGQVIGKASKEAAGVPSRLSTSGGIALYETLSGPMSPSSSSVTTLTWLPTAMAEVAMRMMLSHRAVQFEGSRTPGRR